MSDSCQTFLLCCTCVTACIQCGLLADACSSSKTDNSQPANVTVVTQQPPPNWIQSQPPANWTHNQPPANWAQHQPPANWAQNQPPANWAQNQPPANWAQNQPTAPPTQHHHTIDYYSTPNAPTPIRNITGEYNREAPPSYEQTMRAGSAVRVN